MTEKLVKELFEDFWKWRLQRSPEYASLTGSKDYDDQLETFLPSRFEEDRLKCLSFIEQANGFAQDETILEETRLNLELFKSELNTFVDGYESSGFLFPINNIEGLQVDFSRLADWMSVSTQQDYQNLIKRYQKFPTLARQVMETMKEGLSRKMTNHAVTMTAVLNQLSQHQGDPRLTAFWEPFKDLPETLDEEVAEKLRQDAEAAIREKIQPAMADFADFLKKEYLPNTRPEIGASSLPNGVVYYNDCLKFHTSSERYSAQTIHDIGIAEVKRIEEDMKHIFDEVSFKGTLKEFVDHLRQDEKLIFKTSQELFDHFSNLIFNVIQPKLKDFFCQEPQSKLLVVQTPAAQVKAPAAYYICGTADGSRPGKVFVNCSNPDTRLKCQLTSLALHEANPGHHLQASYALNQKFMPDFRRVMEDRNYFQAPSRFPINTAFCEGWALYCEKLGFEMGLYDNPYDRFGHYSEEMFRACRLVVDTGIHAFGWSRDQAIQYLLDHTATPKHEIEIEIDRYIGWPGQAVGYKIGEIFLTELRRKAEVALQDRFDLRQFHEVLLKTAGPLDLVEKEVDLFIEKMKL